MTENRKESKGVFQIGGLAFVGVYLGRLVI